MTAASFPGRVVANIRTELARRPATDHARFLRVNRETWENRYRQIERAACAREDLSRFPCGCWEASLIVAEIGAMEAKLSVADGLDRSGVHPVFAAAMRAVA